VHVTGSDKDLVNSVGLLKKIEHNSEIFKQVGERLSPQFHWTLVFGIRDGDFWQWFEQKARKGA
jgi:hypothetical protein